MAQPSADAIVPTLPRLARVRGITKSFGGVRALRGVDLDVFAGEVHALLGENGAGKSTLIKLLSGVLTSDGGAIEIGGKAVRFATPAQSRAAGVAVVYQELSLVESLSVGANMMLGREPRTRLGLLKRRALMAEVESFLREHGVPLDPRAPLGSLPFAYRQMTEICKALMGDARILILDEPTSALARDEERILFDAIRAATARGVGVIYVTHRLNEVFRICQRVTVLRDGANVGSFVTAETTMRQLVAAIVGPGHGLTEAPDPIAPARAESAPPRPAVMTLSGVTNDRLRAVDLTLRAGEIHGLAGLVGSGRSEILQTVFGLRPWSEGTITVGATTLRGHGPAAAIGLGIALVPEDRHVQGLVLAHSIERNLTLPRLPQLSFWGFVRRRAAMRRARTAMGRLSMKAPGPATEAGALSGGNQQKVVFAKWNDPPPRILLLDEPTVGVDVGAREEIYGLIRDVARGGAGVLIVCSDLAELLLLCDRVSIVVQGGVVRVLDRDAVESAEALHQAIQLAQPLADPVT